jgi:hypothetical protein
VARRDAEPDVQHRLLTDLAFSAFEAGHFPASVNAASRALAVAPECPRSLWAYACALHLAGHNEEAATAYRQLVAAGIRRISSSCCCRHKAHARGLIADSLLHLSLSLGGAGHSPASREAFIAHMNLRGPGCYSIYSLGALPSGTSSLLARRAVV